MELAVTSREKLGKGMRTLRKEGLVPAELYGHGSANVHLSVSLKEFNKVFKEAGTSTVVTLASGKIKTPAIIHDIQHNFLTGEVDHVDFYQVRMDEAITAAVQLEFTGESKAAKEQQAMVMKTMTELEVEALPGDMPHVLTVDLSLLDEIGKSVHVGDIAVPKGVKVLMDAETVVATATPPTKEEEVAPPPAVDVAEIPTEGEEKKAERDAGKEEKTEEK
jgi:large subunit ribosomal protein L25